MVGLVTHSSMATTSDRTEIEQFMNAGLVKVARAHGKRTSIKLTSIGVYAVGDARIFGKILEGRPITTRQWSRILQWIYDRWPETVAWPADVMRPAYRNAVIVRKPGRQPPPTLPEREI